RLPRSTLFPYTTLFRSVCIRKVHTSSLDQFSIGVKTRQLGRAVFGLSRSRARRDSRAVIRWARAVLSALRVPRIRIASPCAATRSEEHTSELQSPYDLV